MRRQSKEADEGRHQWLTAHADEGPYTWPSQLTLIGASSVAITLIQTRDAAHGRSNQAIIGNQFVVVAESGIRGNHSISVHQWRARSLRSGRDERPSEQS